MGNPMPCQSLYIHVLQLLFPETYTRTAAWLRHESALSQETLERCQDSVRAAVLGHPRFHLLAAGVQV